MSSLASLTSRLPLAWLAATSQTLLGQPDPLRPSATVSYGEIIGTTTVQSSYPYATVNKFLGVPFAKSPPTRFEPAEPSEPWSIPLEATALKPSCYQQFIREDYRDIFNSPPLPESEDCLYLNVYAPASQVEDLPVLFWIHGGNFQLGSGRHPDFDGSSMAANEHVIVVTINYRLNDIPLDKRNLGFLDQRLALQWVYENIRAFGGDPDKITLFGESSGAYSVKQLVVSPPNDNPLPFQAAILQSQSRGDQGGDSKRSWDILAQELGCNNENLAMSQLECMQSAPAETIRHILDRDGLGFAPVVDGKTDVGNIDPASLLDNQSSAVTAAKVPLLVGTNADEGSILAMIFPSPEIALSAIFQDDPAAVEAAFALYPEDASEFHLKNRIITDFAYTCTTSAFADSFAHPKRPVWRYHFNASFPNTLPFPDAGVWHTAEIGLVFGTFPVDDRTTLHQVKTSRYMQHAWAEFARHPEHGPGWRHVGSTDRDLHIIGSEGGAFWGGESVEAHKLDHVCEVYGPAISMMGI